MMLNRALKDGSNGLPWWLGGEGSTCSIVDPSSIPGSGSSPGGGNDNPHQYSCLGNPMDRGAWWATVHGGRKRTGHDLVTKQQHVFILPQFQKVLFLESAPRESRRGRASPRPWGPWWWASERCHRCPGSSGALCEVRRGSTEERGFVLSHQGPVCLP